MSEEKRKAEDIDVREDRKKKSRSTERYSDWEKDRENFRSEHRERAGSRERDKGKEERRREDYRERSRRDEYDRRDERRRREREREKEKDESEDSGEDLVATHGGALSAREKEEIRKRREEKAKRIQQKRKLLWQSRDTPHQQHWELGGAAFADSHRRQKFLQLLGAAKGPTYDPLQPDSPPPSPPPPTLPPVAPQPTPGDPMGEELKAFYAATASHLEEEFTSAVQRREQNSRAGLG